MLARHAICRHQFQWFLERKSQAMHQHNLLLVGVSLIDRIAPIARVLALLWIDYELHGLASTESAEDEPETTVNQVPGYFLLG